MHALCTCQLGTLPSRALDPVNSDLSVYFGAHRQAAALLTQLGATAASRQLSGAVLYYLDRSSSQMLGCAARMDLGDVTFHHGWTLHSAPAQPKHSETRAALSVTYFADGARLLPRTGFGLRKAMHHTEDQESYADWIKELPQDGVARHKLLPLVYGI